MTGYSSKTELNHPDVLGNKELINPFEAVADSTDNRGSNLMAESTDFVSALMRSYQSLDALENAQPSLTYDHTAKTLVVGGSDLNLEMSWYDPSNRTATNTQVILRQGTHNLGTNLHWWLKLVPGGTVDILAGLADITTAPNSTYLLAGTTPQSVQTQLDDLGDPNKVATYTSAQDALLYVPFLRISAKTLSMFGNRWRIRDTYTWKFLDRDTQYVQTNDTTISITATDTLDITAGNALTLTGGVASQLIFGDTSILSLGISSLISMGNNGNFAAGNDFDMIWGTGGEFQFLADFDMGISVTAPPAYDRGFEFRSNSLTVHESIAASVLNLEARNGADLALFVDAGGSFALTANDGVIDWAGPMTWTQTAEAPMDFTSLLDNSSVNWTTLGANSPLLLQVGGASSPLTLASTAAHGSGSYLHLRSPDRTIISRLSGVDYVPDTNTTVTVMDDGGDANTVFTGIMIHDLEHTDVSGGRASGIFFGGETFAGTVHALTSMRVSHFGAAADEQGELRFSVNTGAGLVEAFTIEAGDRFLFGRRPVLIDTNAGTFDKSAIEDLFIDVPAATSWGRASLLAREDIHSNTLMVHMSVDNTDDDANNYFDEYRKSGLSLRAQHSGAMFPQLVLHAQNDGGGNDRATEGYLSIWGDTLNQLRQVMRFDEDGPEIPANMVLNVLGSLDGGGSTVSFLNGISTDTIVAPVAGDLTVNSPLIVSDTADFYDSVRFYAHNVHLNLSDVSPLYAYSIFAKNTPYALGYVDVNSNAAAVAPTVGVRAFQSQSIQGITESANVLTVEFDISADLANSNNANQMSSFAYGVLVYCDVNGSGPGNFVLCNRGIDAVGATPGNNMTYEFLIWDLDTGAVVDLTAANNYYFRIALFAFDPDWVP